MHTAPDVTNSKAVVQLGVHSAGKVLSTFITAGGVAAGGSGAGTARLVTVGQNDGTIMVWALQQS